MEVEVTIRTAFPDQPVPKEFFRDSARRDEEFQLELANRVQNRPWTAVTLTDWRMVGSTPATWREYMLPETFAYYMPSILIGVLAEPPFFDFALEAMLPFNRWHQPRGEWWFSFARAFTDRQRGAMKDFLAHLRASNPPLDLRNEELVEAAETVWA
jgi:hypothetical protein